MTKRTATGWRMAVVLAVFVGVSGHSWAAADHVESFGNGAARGNAAVSRWSGRGAVAVREMFGRLEASFSRQAMVPMPETGSMVATNGASGGAFEGDFVSAGLKEIGFRFLAADVKPSGALVRIFAGKRAYVHTLDLSEVTVGKWTECRFSLEGLEAGGWNGGDATEERFQKDLGRVTCVEVQVSRRGTKAQRYAVDDFYVASRSMGSGIVVEEGGGNGGHGGIVGEHGVWARGVEPKGGGVEIVWCELVPGTAYAVECADGMGEDGEWAWREVGKVLAGSEEEVWRGEGLGGGGGGARVFRLKVSD